MKLFVGLDVSLEKTSICVVSEHGKIMKEAQAASEPETLTRWIEQLDDNRALMVRSGKKSGQIVPLPESFPHRTSIYQN